MAMLVSGSIVFSKDAKYYVVVPIEEMLGRVKQITWNP